MVKGADTKKHILEKGLDIASRVGLEQVSIGNLAKEMRMSKSGLFAHFNSKENLQIEIMSFAGELFTDKVIRPTLQVPRGMARIRALVDNWIHWTQDLSGGCIFVSASTEFSERPGRVRDFILHQQQMWLESLNRIGQSAIKSGDFKSDTNCEQFAYDLYSLLLGFHYYDRLLRDPNIEVRKEHALEQLIQQYQNPKN